MNDTSEGNQENEKNTPKKTIREWLTLNWSKSKYISIIGVLVPFVVGVVIITTTSLPGLLFPKPLPELSTTDFRPPQDILDFQLRYSMRYFIDKLLQQENIINNINNRLDVLTKSDTTTAVGVQIALIHSDVKTLNSRIQILENSLLENPEKALAIPLIRKDIKRIEDSYKQSVAEMVRSIDRVYDQNKWFIGGTALALITLAISNFVQMRKKE